MTQERNVLSAMFPAHADLQPILGKIREKYDLPKLGLMDKEISDLLLADKNIPWDEIREEIRNGVEAHPELWLEQIPKMRLFVQKNQTALDDPNTFPEVEDANQEQVRSATTAMLKLIRPITEAYTRKVDDMCELLFVYLATGETKQIPKDWLGAVYTNQIFVEPPRKRNCRRHYSCRAGRVEFCASQTAPTWLDLNS